MCERIQQTSSLWEEFNSEDNNVFVNSDENSTSLPESNDESNDDFKFDLNAENDDECTSPQPTTITQTTVTTKDTTLSSFSERSSLTYCAIQRTSKGKLVTKQTNHRIKKHNDTLFSFVKLLDGDIKKAQEVIDRVSQLNAGNEAQKIMADGIVYEYFQQGLSWRVAKKVFKYGTSRLQRVTKIESKKKPGGSNGRELTEEDIDRLDSFMMKGLQWEEGFPCDATQTKTLLYIVCIIGFGLGIFSALYIFY